MMMTVEEMEREHQKDLRRLRNFRLLDDDFMTRVFDGEPRYIQLVLRIVLQMPELEVIEVRTQVFVENLLKRSVQLDIVARDGAGRIFNVEIQRADEGADPRRARYNSSMVDANLLSRKSMKFYALPDAWVIFITENDVFGEGRALYPVERYMEGSGKKFDDGSHILYVNGAYRGEDDVGRLMHDFSCTNPDDMYYEALAERTRHFKESKEGIAIMCKAMEDMREEYLRKGIEQGVRQGERTGEKKRAEEVALRMLRAGKYAVEEIVDMSGLSMAEVQGLKASATA